MLKPPRPGSTGDSTSSPRPPSCSPFSGKSSSNTNTASFAGGSGVDTEYTVTGVKAPVVAGHAPVPAAGVQLLGAPPIPLPGAAPPVLNGLPALPGKTVM